MDQKPANANNNPLLTARIIWGAMLLGEIMFLAIALTIGAKLQAADPQVVRVLLYAAVAMLVTTIPIGFVVRGFIYRAGRREGRLKPSAYTTGNIVLWALCESPAFVATVGLLLNGGRGPHLYAAFVAMAVQAITFPTGGALQVDSTNPMRRP